MKKINLTKTISLEYGKQEGRILNGNKILAKFYSCTDGLLVATGDTPPVPYDWKPSGLNQYNFKKNEIAYVRDKTKVRIACDVKDDDERISFEALENFTIYDKGAVYSTRRIFVSRDKNNEK